VEDPGERYADLGEEESLSMPRGDDVVGVIEGGVEGRGDVQEEKMGRSLSWSRGTLDLRQERQTLEAEQALHGKCSNTVRLQRLQQGEGAYWRLLPLLIKGGYTSLDAIPRINTVTRNSTANFRIPPVKGDSPQMRLQVQDWLNDRTIRQWHTLAVQTAKKTKLQDIIAFTEVTTPSLPDITDLQLALKHLLKLERPQAQAWWAEFLQRTTPTVKQSYEHERQGIYTLVAEGWDAENWRGLVESALSRLGPLIPPKPRRQGRTGLIENRGSASASGYGVHLITGISGHRIRWGTKEFEFKCTLRVPSLERLQELLAMKDRALQEELSSGKDLIRMPTSWFPKVRSPLNGWWVKGVSTVSLKRCAVCDRFQTDHAYVAAGSSCQTCAKGETREASHSFSEIWKEGLLLRTVLPDLLEVEGDTTLLTSEAPRNKRCVRACLQTMIRLYHDSRQGKRSSKEAKSEARKRRQEEERVEQRAAVRGGLTGTELRHQRQSLRSFLGPSRPSAEPGDGDVDGRDVLRETGIERQVMDGELDWAEGWLTSTQLGFPLTQDIFIRGLHPLVSQYARDKGGSDQGLRQLVEEWGERQTTIKCDGCGTCQQQGQWWICAECDDVDLCEECHRRYLAGAPLHPPGHAFLPAEKEDDMDLQEMSATEVEDTDPTKHRGQASELFSVPHLARDPLYIPDKELLSENIRDILENPPDTGVVRVFLDPISHELPWLDTTVVVTEGIAAGTGPSGNFQIEGARWHFLREVIATRLDAHFVPSLMSEIQTLSQRELAEDYICYNWTVLRTAQQLFSATCLLGTSMLTAPPFFQCAIDGQKEIWGTGKGPAVIVLNEWPEAELDLLETKLSRDQAWTVLTTELPKSSVRRKILEKWGRRIATGEGNVRKWKGWWKTGMDRCASYKIPSECWVSKEASPTSENVSQMEAALSSKDDKERPVGGNTPLELIYLDGSEVGLLGIHRLVRAGKALLRSADGSAEGSDMSAGVFRQEDGQILTAKVGRSREGISSTRPETGALSMALADTRDRNKALIYVGDSKALLTTVAGWVGEGKNKSLAQCPDGDILREVVDELHYSVEKGVATILIKIKSHRGELFNELSDRAADNARLNEDTPMRWNRPSGRPIFVWQETEDGPEMSACMGKKVKKIIKARAAVQQLSDADNLTSKFLREPDSSRDLIHLFLKDSRVHDKAKRRLIQTITHQFPCQAYLHTRSMTASPFCKMCQARNIPDQTENVGHIQGYCPALELPRIAAHHCIWRELMALLKKHSSEKSVDKETTKWSFPTATDEDIHKEWNMLDILTYIQSPLLDSALRDAVQSFLRSRDLPTEEKDITSFLDKRPDGVAFDDDKKAICFLEFTRAMDSREGWEARKEDEKIARYKYNLEFINELSEWNASQINFTVGVRGSISSQVFTSKLLKLGVTESRLREEIRKKVGRRTLEMHDLMLRSYYQAKFNPTLSIDQIQLARTEKESRAIHHKLYLSFAHR